VVAKKTTYTKKNKNQTPRIILIPMTGGMLSLIPIFAGLSALGSLAAGVAGIVKAVNEWKSNKNAHTHLGKGLYRIKVESIRSNRGVGYMCDHIKVVDYEKLQKTNFYVTQ
jgi:galactokinase/mevalonate kinase-like predicted kinase